MAASHAISYLTKNALNYPNIDNSGQNCCGHFRYGRGKPWKFEIFRNITKNSPPTPGIEPRSPGWKPGILSTRPRGMLYQYLVENRECFSNVYNLRTLPYWLLLSVVGGWLNVYVCLWRVGRWSDKCLRRQKSKYLLRAFVKILINFCQCKQNIC